MSQVDTKTVERAIRALPGVLAHEELVVERTLPQLTPAEALDTALRRSLMRLRFELNQASFEFLRWKVATARAENERLRARLTHSFESAMLEFVPSSLPLEPPASTERTWRIRTITDEHGVLWTVSALSTLTPTDPELGTCLIFSTDDSVACVWDYPDNWTDLSDAELDALRRNR
jgi:hypothetical protein